LSASLSPLFPLNLFAQPLGELGTAVSTTAGIQLPNVQPPKAGRIPSQTIYPDC